MQKTQAYHEAAIEYNEGLAEAAETLAPTLEHEEVQKWCVAVGKQHRFHAKRHRSALNKFLLKTDAPPVEALIDGLDVPEPSEMVDSPIEQPTTSSSNVEELAVTQTFSDGCQDTHKPMEESCEFYPPKVANNG